MAEAPRGIQATLFDYFQDTEYFDLQQAQELILEHEQRDVNVPSIRARIYEGIDKGLFERVGKGLYMVTRDNADGSKSNCLLINGDGRDLSIFADSSLDAIITDHPYALKKSLKGGNRNFAEYELFEYTEADFKEKHRVLKPGHFLVEFLPEENADNYEYLFRVKEMARKSGMQYYAKVAWRKGDFVANTGRKSKNTEDICFFTKGRARDLRPDAKKDKAEPGVSHYMSGAAGMLPTTFDTSEEVDLPSEISVSPPGKKERIHQAEKPVELLEQILKYVTLPGETALDQFAGSGALGEAALRTGRHSILIEKDVATYQKLVSRLEALGRIEAIQPEARQLVSLGSDALVAQDAFRRTGDRSILTDFVKTHVIDPAALYDAEHELRKGEAPETHEAITAAMDAIEEMDLRAAELDLVSSPSAQSDIGAGEKGEDKTEAPSPKVLECSSRGDRRFSALFAKVTIKGKELSIEEWFQNAKRTIDGKRAGKGKPCDYIVCPFTGDKLPADQAVWLYRGLWVTYLTNHPDLVEYASQFDDFSDSFQDSKARDRQITADPFNKDAEFFYHHPDMLSSADVIAAYVKGDRERYVSVVKASDWYQNMAAKKRPLSEQIRAAESRGEGTATSSHMAQHSNTAITFSKKHGR